MLATKQAENFSAISLVSIRPERAYDAHAIERLCDSVFGPGAQARAAAALREGVAHDIALSFVATLDAAIIGTCRLTPVIWGGVRIMMLGPLGVSRAHMSTGIGRKLMSASLEAADAAGEEIVFLVGDLAYYAPSGFSRVAPSRISLPRPVDPSRVLAREAVEGVSTQISGPVIRAL